MEELLRLEERLANRINLYESAGCESNYAMKVLEQTKKDLESVIRTIELLNN